MKDTTDTRITEAMVNAALRSFYHTPATTNFDGDSKDDMRAAIKAALSVMPAISDIPTSGVVGIGSGMSDDAALLSDLRQFHEETEACNEFDLPNEAIAALLVANLIEGTHYMLTTKGEAVLAASPSSAEAGEV